MLKVLSGKIISIWKNILAENLYCKSQTYFFLIFLVISNLLWLFSTHPFINESVWKNPSHARKIIVHSENRRQAQHAAHVLQSLTVGFLDHKTPEVQAHLRLLSYSQLNNILQIKSNKKLNN